jgi:hypothetical protein
MTNARRYRFSFALLLLAASCKSNEKSAPQGSSVASAQPVAAPASASAPAVLASASSAPAAPAAKPGGCPTSVAGATATAADTADGVALTIVAKDPGAAADVRDRAHGLVQLAASGGIGKSGQGGGGGGGDGTGPGPGDGSGKGASGGGGGGGGLGRCPVLLRSVTIDVQDTKDGAVVTMRPKNPSDLDSVRKQVRKRLAGD